MAFTNEYKKIIVGTDPTNPEYWRLSVSNKVYGLLADQTAYFKYDMTVTAPGSNTSAEPYIAFVVELEDEASSKYRMSSDPIANGASSSGIMAFVPGENTTFYLKHNQYLVFLDLPNGAGFSVTESKDDLYIPGAYATSNGVKSAFESRTESSNLAIPHINNSVIKNPLFIGGKTNSVDFTNNRIEKVSTGLNLTSLPFTIMLALTLSSLAIYVTIKANRKKHARPHHS
jgi:hypothetical protein